MVKKANEPGSMSKASPNIFVVLCGTCPAKEELDARTPVHAKIDAAVAGWRMTPDFGWMCKECQIKGEGGDL